MINKGEISLVFKKNRDGKTVMARKYSKSPLKVLKPHYYDIDGTAFVYSLNQSGGVLQNDFLRTELVCEEASSAVFTTPGYSKFHRMDEGFAKVENYIHVKKDAIMEYLPDPNVPFAGASVYQENEFRIEPGGKLIAVDMMTPGRVAGGESFQYDIYSSKTKIYMGDELALYDSCSVEPEKVNVLEIGRLEGRSINGTMYICGENCGEEIANALTCIETKNANMGAGKIRDDLVVVRFMGDNMMEVSELVRRIWDVSRKILLGKPAIHLRKEFSYEF